MAAKKKKAKKDKEAPSPQVDAAVAPPEPEKREPVPELIVEAEAPPAPDVSKFQASVEYYQSLLNGCASTDGKRNRYYIQLLHAQIALGNVDSSAFSTEEMNSIQFEARLRKTN